MESKESNREELSSAKAVLVGALAPGVNAPTWNTLKMAFLMLVVCLAVMLGLAFSSSDFSLTLHVAFLFLITGTLFVLLSSFSQLVKENSCEACACLTIFLHASLSSLKSCIKWFLAETGFVSVEYQMDELGLAPRDEDTNKKTS
ncbi:hypothetical protein RDI58_005191 [Solanum bulbocastanum]|uniref:Transmembrane protein n=1 Tax=Solanum bulbocastanum TaxID=147425 RepID=A0AAN8U347_SOLBU